MRKIALFLLLGTSVSFAMDLARVASYSVLPGKKSIDKDDNNKPPVKPTIPASLSVPNLSINTIRGARAGLRPFREGSIRLEKEPYFNKWLIHNYGHGDAGIALSLGSAMHCAQLLQEIYTESPHLQDSSIAILGGGVIGLTLAHYLLLKGCKVRLYMEKRTPHTTSDKAAGIWRIQQVDKGSTYEEQELFKKVALDSLIAFEKLADKKDTSLSGIDWVESYRIFDDERGKLKLAPEFEFLARSMRDITHTTIQFNGVTKHVAYYKSILVDVNEFMRYLFDQVSKMGGIIERKEFNSLNDIQNLFEPIICNCTGLGSLTLFNDTQLKPLFGQMLVFKQDPSKPINYLITKYLQPKDSPLSFITLVPAKDVFFVGTTYKKYKKEDCFKNGKEICEIDPEVSEILLATIREVLCINSQLHTNNPSF